MLKDPNHDLQLDVERELFRKTLREFEDQLCLKAGIEWPGKRLSDRFVEIAIAHRDRRDADDTREFATQALIIDLLTASVLGQIQCVYPGAQNMVGEALSVAPWLLGHSPQPDGIEEKLMKHKYLVKERKDKLVRILENQDDFNPYQEMIDSMKFPFKDVN